MSETIDGKSGNQRAGQVADGESLRCQADVPDPILGTAIQADQLLVGDMVAAVLALGEPCDLMVAADVLTYVGDLTDVMHAVRARLTSEGLFAFTVQRHEGDGFVLGAEHRFSHSRTYIEDIAATAQFSISYLENAVSRQEKGVDAPGLAAVFRAR